MRAAIAPYALTLVLGWVAPAGAQYANESGAPCQNLTPGTILGQCLSNAANAADEKLNHTYGAIRGFLESEKRTDDRDALVKAERAWVQYRDGECAAAYGLYGGGSGGPPERFACVEALTRQRTEDLKTNYGWLLSKFDHPLK